MNGKPRLRSLLLLAAILASVLCFLFHKSFSPDQALFSNDGPLGVILSRPIDMPQAFIGIWNDNYWIGAYNGNLTPNFSGLIHLIYTPILQGLARVNFYCPTAILILGLCAWIFFRSIGCNSRSAILAALAAALNMNFFSNAAWGLGTRSLSLAGAFLALSAIETGFVVQPILTSIIAGLAIGLSITEGGDNGAFFSMFIGVYTIWRTWITIPSRSKAVAWSAAKVIVMVAFAAIMASQTLSIFARTSVKGVVGTEQDTQTKESKWIENTAWSLPKIETLRVIIPGVFGYHMLPYAHSPEQAYWGRVGEFPGQSQRSSGAGEYAGVLVVLIAIWATVESFRKKGQAFSPVERKIVWYWAGAAIVAMCLGWGRHAPFYRVIYALPYFSTIRNPMKFFHVFDMCLMILFAYGLLGLSRRYLDVPLKDALFFGQLKAWWAKAPSHEKLWTLGCIAALALAVVGWFGYMGSKPSVVKYLTENGFPEQELARSIASFSIREVFFFVLTVAACVGLLTLIISGAFAGPRATWAGVLLGIVIIVDLSRADAPWIKYSKWKETYAANAILDTLREKPYEHRATFPNIYQLVQMPDVKAFYERQPQVWHLVQQAYGIYYGNWLQHEFPYYGVQSIDVAQEPRKPADKQAFYNAIGMNWTRLWELTNVRYISTDISSLPEILNQKFDPARRRFRLHTAYTVFQNGEGLGVQTNSTGPLALFEFTGALPRAKLYNNWEVITDEKALLARLGDANWDPAASMLLSQDAPKPTAAGAAPGKAEILSNPSTKLMDVQTTSDAPAMLLLNDKIEPEWHAYIDGKQSPVLRANYLMRGVYVPAGTHKVVFKYEMKSSGFFLVLVCDIVGLLLVAIVVWSAKRKKGSLTNESRA